MTGRAGQRAATMSPEKRSRNARKAALAKAKQREQEGWKPSPAHRRALDLAAEDISIVNDPARLAEELKLSKHSILRWRRNPDFLAWWNDQVLQLARMSTAPAVARLIGIVQDPTTKPSTAVKAIDALMKHIPVTQRSEAGDSLMRLLDRWKGKRIRAAIEIEQDVPGGAQCNPDNSLRQLPAIEQSDSEATDSDGGGGRHGAPIRRSTTPRLRVQVTQDEEELRELGALVSGPASLEGAARRAMDELEAGEPASSAAPAEGQRSDDAASPTGGQGSEDTEAGVGWSSGDSDHLSPQEESSEGEGRSEITNAAAQPEVADAYDEAETRVCRPHRWDPKFYGGRSCPDCGVPWSCEAKDGPCHDWECGVCRGCGAEDPDWSVHEPRGPNIQMHKSDPDAKPCSHAWRTGEDGAPVCERCGLVAVVPGAAAVGEGDEDYVRRRLMDRLDSSNEEENDANAL